MVEHERTQLLASQLHSKWGFLSLIFSVANSKLIGSGAKLPGLKSWVHQFLALGPPSYLLKLTVAVSSPLQVRWFEVKGINIFSTHGMYLEYRKCSKHIIFYSQIFYSGSFTTRSLWFGASDMTRMRKWQYKKNKYLIFFLNLTQIAY